MIYSSIIEKILIIIKDYLVVKYNKSTQKFEIKSAEISGVIKDLLEVMPIYRSADAYWLKDDSGYKLLPKKQVVKNVLYQILTECMPTFTTSPEDSDHWGQEVSASWTTKALDTVIALIMNYDNFREYPEEEIKKLLEDKILFNNVYYDLKQNKIRKYDHQFKKSDVAQSNILDINYATSTEHTKETKDTWSNFLNAYKQDGDEDLVYQIMELVCSTLLGTKYLRKAFILKGDGKNGKSGIIGFIKSIHQQAVSSEQLNALSGERGFSRLNLMDSRVNVIDDLNKTTPHQTGVFKTLVSGGITNAEVKGGSSYSFENKAVFVIGTNSHINFREDSSDSSALADRLHIIHFKNKIQGDNTLPEAVQHKDIKDYVVSTCLDKILPILITKGLKEVKETTEQLEEYKTTANPALDYLKEKQLDIFVVKEDNRMLVHTTTAYSDFVSWCKISGYYASNIANFGKSMSQHFGEYLTKPRLTNEITQERSYFYSIDRKDYDKFEEEYLN